METKEELNKRAKSCLYFGDYHFMVSKIKSGKVTEEPAFFGRLIMSKVDELDYINQIKAGEFDHCSDVFKIGIDDWSVFEETVGCYIFSEQKNEYYYITRY